ncbi:FIG00471280: hypothetical protein [hydrothermal vent metagenome]|uniref:Cas10/Cmr2 second palm domain-containing protein n=1 Tax=hydrothermal vent metagenome TaxID=652676 RepID=A0A1W1C7J9_9ZZZZ
MSKYLYGASVQGIQDFIFATNKLQEIVGASEIVKSIADIFKKKYNPDEILINTAGNIKAIFDTKEACQKVVLEFPKIISQMAYGITISQAVVAFDGEAKDYINELEKRLKIQRNKPSIPLDISINIMKLNPKTARAKINQDEDMATSQKLKANREFYKKNPTVTEFKDFSYMKNSKGKIAVIHIDGNGLGKIVKDLGEKLSAFSIELDKATKKAVKDAKKDSMHIREVIVGGDDVTVICNANDALAFTKNFLTNFEDETKRIKELEGIKDKLTACAGIAYCNEKYPFHYAVDLAETLCGVAKNHSNREHSCLMFHNIQGSHYQSWDKFVEDELTIRNDTQTIRCDFGAYYLDKEDEANISDFINTLEAYRCDNSPISRLRDWLSELYKSDKNAQNLLHRINTITKQNDNWKCEIMNNNLKFFDKNLSNDTLIIEKHTQKEREEIKKNPDKAFKRTPIYDILQILSITEAK